MPKFAIGTRRAPSALAVGGLFIFLIVCVDEKLF